jgi:osmoprotectant transport system permease protein
VNPLTEAVLWLNDPLNWQGPDGVLALTGQHLWISFLAVVIACAIAWTLGLWLGHTGRGGNAVVVISNASRAIPTLALLTILSSIGAWFFGTPATVISLAIFAIPPLLSNTFVGIRGVDPDVVDAARGMGLSASQTLWRVEVPLAIPLIAAGFRTAAVQVVATTTLAALGGGARAGHRGDPGAGPADAHAGPDPSPGRPADQRGSGRRGGVVHRVGDSRTCFGAQATAGRTGESTPYDQV